MTRVVNAYSARFAVCVGLLGIVLSFSPGKAISQAPSAIELQARAASTRYAALQAVIATATAIGKDNLDSRAEGMEMQMLTEAPRHRERAVSQKMMRSSVEKSIDEEFSRVTAEVWVRFRLEELGVKRDEFQRDVNQKLRPRFAGERDRAVNANFDRVFSSARTSAVSKQANALRAATYPSQDQVEAIDQQGWNSAAGKEAIVRIEQSVKGTTETVFEENKKQVDQLVREVRDAIDSQRAAQLQRLDTTDLPSGPLSREFARAALEGSLRELLTAERAKSRADPVYAELPSARRKVDEVSTRAESDRFMQFLRSFAPEVNQTTLRARLNADLEEYRLREPTLERLTQEMLRTAELGAVRSYTQQPISKTDTAVFRARLAARIKEAPHSDVLRTAVTERLTAVLDPVRNEIAREQVKEFFSAVAARTWAVPEGELKVFVDNRSEPHDFKNSIKLENVIGKKPLPQSRLLSETESLVLNTVRELVAEGKQAWMLQMQIVEKLAEPLRREMTDAAKRGALGDRNRWIATFTDRVEREWSSIRPTELWPKKKAQPENAANKYAPLFNETRRLIAERVNLYFKPPDVVVEREDPPAPPRPEATSKPEASQPGEVGKQPGDGGGGKGGGVGGGTGSGIGSGTGAGEGTGQRSPKTEKCSDQVWSWERWWLALGLVVAGAVIGYLAGMRRRRV